MRLQERAEAEGRKQFLGVPVKDFAAAGKEQLRYLLRAGMNRESKVADLGCGVLRGGYWLIHFLNAGNYYGVEPHTERLKIGMWSIVEPEVLEAKCPRFDTNPLFDTSVFGVKFDFFLAYSIWTHASKQQVQMTLASFVRDSTANGVFLTTYLRPDWRHRDYQGDRWYGTSHESKLPGCIRHSSDWIRAACGRLGLAVSELGRDETHGQYWLQITRGKTAQEAQSAVRVC